VLVKKDEFALRKRGEDLCGPRYQDTRLQKKEALWKGEGPEVFMRWSRGGQGPHPAIPVALLLLRRQKGGNERVPMLLPPFRSPDGEIPLHRKEVRPNAQGDHRRGALGCVRNKGEGRPTGTDCGGDAEGKGRRRHSGVHPSRWRSPTARRTRAFL